jgi:hypothetical protein
MPSHRCCYVLKTWGDLDPITHLRTPPEYCGAPVGWTNPIDEDGNRYRKYNMLCDKHQKLVDAMPPEEDEEW